MFIHKRIIVFFILKNIVLSFCEIVHSPVDIISKFWSSEYVYSDESKESPPGPELLDSKNDSIQQNWAMIFPESNANEDSKHNFEKYSKGTFNANLDSSKSSEENLDSSEETDNFRSFKENLNSLEEPENPEINLKNVCFGEDHSMISYSDLKYLIEHKAETLNIEENIINYYYSDAKAVFLKYMDDLEEFQKRFQERPGHMQHILHGLRSFRHSLEPDVEDIGVQLEQFHNLEDNFNGFAKSSVAMLNQFDKYKKLCNINCEETGLENRFGPKTVNNSLIVLNATGMYCIRLKDLNDNINMKLSELQAQYEDGLTEPFEIIDKIYELKILEFKNDLKEAAVKQFGMTMYDILSLHDDYHHFLEDLEHVNISSKILNIQENTAEIGFKRIGLKRDLEKYRKYCMNCGNQRVKRNIFDNDAGSTLHSSEELHVIPIELIKDAETGENLSVVAAVDLLIQAKIDEIRERIEFNFTSMFAVLDTKLNDTDVIEEYVRDLRPIQEDIENEIKSEQEALHRLRSRVPEESIDKIIALLNESERMLRNLESAKRLIDQYI